MTAGEPVRLAKRVAALLGCSRATAEAHVAGGWVRVDGAVVDRPEARVQPGQQVTVDPAADLSQLAPATLLLHQPAGLGPAQALALLRPDAHWPADPVRTPLLPAHVRGTTALLPLPPQAEGLAVYSQVAGVQRKLQDRQFPIEQEWVVELPAPPAPAALAALARATTGRVSRQSEQALRLAFKGFDALQLPAALAAAGLPATRLRRLRLGRVALAQLPAGQWRRLGLGERF